MMIAVVRTTTYCAARGYDLVMRSGRWVGLRALGACRMEWLDSIRSSLPERADKETIVEVEDGLGVLWLPRLIPNHNECNRIKSAFFFFFFSLL